MYNHYFSQSEIIWVLTIVPCKKQKLTYCTAFRRRNRSKTSRVFSWVRYVQRFRTVCPSGLTDQMPPLLFCFRTGIDSGPEALYYNFCKKQVTVDKVQNKKSKGKR
jgi:hypothetical protein